MEGKIDMLVQGQGDIASRLTVIENSLKAVDELRQVVQAHEQVLKELRAQLSELYARTQGAASVVFRTPPLRPLQVPLRSG